MMVVVQFEDVYAEQPERLPERARHMEPHLAFLAGHDDQVVAAGALRPSADGVPTGGIWIVSAENKAAVETLCRDDPFWTAGLAQVGPREPLGPRTLVAAVRRLHGGARRGVTTNHRRLGLAAGPPWRWPAHARDCVPVATMAMPSAIP